MVGVVSQEAQMLGELRESMHGVDLLRSDLADEREELLKVGVVRERYGLVHPVAEAAVAVHGPAGQDGRAAGAVVFEDLRAQQVRRHDDHLVAYALRPTRGVLSTDTDEGH